MGILSPAAAGFVVLDWAVESGAVYAEWLNFSEAFGEPGNEPDVEGSDMVAVLTQTTPGAVVTGSQNIYNPGGVSEFNVLLGSGVGSAETVVLQARGIGEMDQESGVLVLSDGTEVAAVVDEIGRESGGFGDTVIVRWTYEVSGSDVSEATIRFSAAGTHLSLASARLDILGAVSSTSIVLETPLHDRWDYPFNATPGFRARASVFRAVGDSGISRHGNFIIVFDVSEQLADDMEFDPANYQLKSATVELLTSDNFQTAYDPSYDPVFTYLPDDHELHQADSDPGRPIELFAAAFNHGLDILTWTEDGDFTSAEDNYPDVVPALPDDSGQLVDVRLAVDFAEPVDREPLALGALQDTLPGDPIPFETIMSFRIDSPGIGLDYVSSSLQTGRIGFVVTSLNGGGLGNRSFPEFQTSDSLIGEGPRLILEFTPRTGPGPSVVSLVGIQFEEDRPVLIMESESTPSVRIRYSADLKSWNVVENPRIDMVGDGLYQWVHDNGIAGEMFYTIESIDE